MRRRLPSLDNRAMSGKWQAFFVIIGFAFGFPLVGAIWPIATRERIADVLGIGLWIMDSLEGGITEVVVVGAVVVGILFTMIGGVFLAAEQVYGWIKKRRDSTVNEYQIK